MIRSKAKHFIFFSNFHLIPIGTVAKKAWLILSMKLKNSLQMLGKYIKNRDLASFWMISQMLTKLKVNGLSPTWSENFTILVINSQIISVA